VTSEKIGRRHHHVVAGFARQELRLERVVGIEGVVANLDPGLLAEILDDVWSDVVRPIVDVDDALFRLRGGRRDGHGGGCNKGEPDRSAHGSTPQDHRMKKWERRSWTGSAANRLALRPRPLLALRRQTDLLPALDSPRPLGLLR